MTFSAYTQKFEGPLDLMLHLIKDKKLDIFDLDMDILLEQYLNYLNNLEKLHLEIESEYLVELATLMEYKSKKLLPHDESIDIEADESDSKEILVQRLLEYQKFKDVSNLLNISYMDRQKNIAKNFSISDIPINENDNLKIEGNPYDLVKALNKVLRRLQLNKPLETKVTKQELSVEEMILNIKLKTKTLPKVFSFDTLARECKNIHEVIVSFLAILDLAKDGFLNFNIDADDKIWLKRGIFDE